MQFRRWQMAGDPHRPGDHFLPPGHWTVWPFFQWTPRSDRHNGGPFHWGYAVSDDLLRWRDLPIVISPTANGSRPLIACDFPNQ